MLSHLPHTLCFLIMLLSPQVFDLCRRMGALAVLFRRGRTPPVPENLDFNLRARKRSLEDQEDIIWSRSHWWKRFSENVLALVYYLSYHFTVTLPVDKKSWIKLLYHLEKDISLYNTSSFSFQSQCFFDAQSNCVKMGKGKTKNHFAKFGQNWSIPWCRSLFLGLILARPLDCLEHSQRFEAKPLRHANVDVIIHDFDISFVQFDSSNAKPSSVWLDSNQRPRSFLGTCCQIVICALTGEITRHWRRSN